MRSRRGMAIHRSGPAWLVTALASGHLRVWPVAPRAAEPDGTAIAADVSPTSCDFGSSVHNVAWSADGAEIFYLTYDGGDSLGNVAVKVAVKAARADRRETRNIEGFAPQHYYLGLAAPPDASAIYTTVIDDTRGAWSARWSTSSAKTESARSRTRRPSRPRGPSSRRLYRRHHFDLRHIDRRGVKSNASLGRDSYPGMRSLRLEINLLLAAPGAGVGLTLDTMGSLPAMPAVPQQEGRLASPSWNADGIRILLTDTSGAFQILNVTTGATTMVGAPVADGGFVSPCAAWSRDGTKVLFRTTCAPMEGPTASMSLTPRRESPRSSSAPGIS